MNIIVKVTKNYGVEAIYPTGDISKLLLKLTGRKTFSRSHIATIKKLGYDVAVEKEEL